MTSILLVTAVVIIAVVNGLPLEDFKQNLDKLSDVIEELRLRSLGKPSRIVGELVKKWSPNSGVNPEELGSYLDGDILTTNLNRNGLLNTAYRWPKGVIPYVISGNFTASQRTMISQAMDAYHQNTCIRFRTRLISDVDYINIGSAATGCWSYLGRNGGMQNLNLQTPGCVYYVGTVIHELMHAVGFYHEQCRLDRDNFVDIMWPNIQPGTEHNFNTYDSNPFNITYDYGSVMHYSAKAFSANGLATIVPKQTGVVIGQRGGFSISDIAKIRAMYKCNGSISNL